MPRRLLLTAGSAGSVRQQLGLLSGEMPEPPQPAQLPVSADVRKQLQDWAATSVALHFGGRRDVEAQRRWDEQGLAVASALAGQLDPDIQWRYLAPSALSPVDGHPVADPVAGLFRDDLGLPELPVGVAGRPTGAC